MENAPDFFIIGAARAGTTSLYHYLNQHPDLFLPKIDKEPGYYCDIWGITDSRQYCSLFTDAQQHQLCGEASTAYITCPASPNLIFEANPDARIIILLRNPVERAYSLYNRMVNLGHETRFPFARALEAEPLRATRDPAKQYIKGYYYNYLYLDSGRYRIQLERYLSFFSRKNTFIILFDALKRAPIKTSALVYGFLGVDDTFQPKTAIHNPAAFPRSIYLQFFLRRGFGDTIRRLKFPHANEITQTLMKLNTGTRKPLPLNPETYNSLVEKYSEDIRATEDLINRDLSHWLELK